MLYLSVKKNNRIDSISINLGGGDPDISITILKLFLAVDALEFLVFNISCNFYYFLFPFPTCRKYASYDYNSDICFGTRVDPGENKSSTSPRES
jgi:hypothetical protein